MLRLAVIVHNPTADNAITLVGVVIVALLAAVVVVLWVVLAGGLVHRDEGPDDPALDTLRRLRLVVRPRKSRDPNAAVVSELDPDGESEPTSR